MIRIPIYDYQCKECGEVFENIEVWKSHAVIECPECKSSSLERLIGTPNIRMDSDSIKHNLPDASPPLEELRGKGTEGYKDKPYASTYLKDYTRHKDKRGNIEWREKRRQYIDMGRK